MGGFAFGTNRSDETLCHGREQGRGNQIRFNPHLQKAGNGTGAVVCVQGGQHNVAGQRSLNGDLRSLPIPDLTDHDDVRILPQGMLQKLGKVDMLFIDGNHRKKPALQYFHQCLQHIHDDSVLILDDIHWSVGMEEAWKEIQEHPSVTVTIDLFRMGLVFFNGGLSKEDFILHF